MNRNVVIIGGILVLAIGGALAWYLAAPLFIDNTVDEEFPIDLPTVAEAEAMSGEELETAVNDALNDIDGLNDSEMEQVEGRLMELAAKMPDHEMDDEMPASEPTVFARSPLIFE